MELELGELRSFLMLAGTLHFRKAAEQLFLSQPALSKQIRRLEGKVNGPLLTRTRRKVALTEAGTVLLSKARKLLRDAEIALELTQAAAEGKAGVLRIGFGIASVPEILPRTLLRFRQAYPGVELEMRDMSSPSQVAAIVDGSLDAGLVRLPVTHPELMSVSLFREHLLVVTPAKMTWRRHRGLAGLRHSPFIALPRSASETFHDHVLALCRRFGFLPRVVQQAGEVFTILNLVRAGLGVSIVPSSAVGMKVPGIRFHNLRTRDAEWQIGIVWRRDSDKKKLISRWIEVMRAAV